MRPELRPTSPQSCVIHVVEDDLGVADSLTFALNELGHIAVSHRNAESVFQSPPPRPTDIFIVDLSLPGISGSALIRWLANLACPPRIIAMSGQPFRRIEREIRGLSLEALLRKPLSMDSLVAAL